MIAQNKCSITADLLQTSKKIKGRELQWARNQTKTDIPTGDTADEQG
jgi:hypothetical protein